MKIHTASRTSQRRQRRSLKLPRIRRLPDAQQRADRDVDTGGMPSLGERHGWRRRPVGGAATVAVTDAVAEAVGQTRRADPVLPGTGGPAGNALLTAWTALVLLVASVAELLTLVNVNGLLSWHVAIGALLVPPALMKTTSTGWRTARYYTGHPLVPGGWSAALADAAARSARRGLDTGARGGAGPRGRQLGTAHH